MLYPLFSRIKKHLPITLVGIGAYSLFMYLQMQEPGGSVNKTGPAPEAEMALDKEATAQEAALEKTPYNGNHPGEQYPGDAVGLNLVTFSPGVVADRETESLEPTPEEINPFLPDGSVAEDPANRQVKAECPTSITGSMKTRHGYELLESMGCAPDFDY